MTKKARLIITFKCPRTCEYCCNNYTKIMSNAQYISNLGELREYGEILITGGEPFYNPSETLSIIKGIKELYGNKKKIYLYSAYYKNEIREEIFKILNLIDGFHFTLHKKSRYEDIKNFIYIQEVLNHHYRKKSLRLYINKDISSCFEIPITPYLWDRVERKPWLTEKELIEMQPDGLPNNEVLLILNKKGEK